MQKALFALLLTFTALFAASCARAEQPIVASLARMPIHAPNPSEGVQVQLVKALARASGTDITYNIFPFARSVTNVESGLADFHIPLIRNTVVAENDLKFFYSRETIFHVNFVLYTRRGSGVAVENLARYNIASDRAHVDYFPFHVQPSNSIELSLKMLSMGRIDGYIFADSATDPVLKSLHLTNIQRSIYQRFDVKIIYPRTPRGAQVAVLMSKALDKLKASGELAEIENPVDLPYDNWQP
ncbi:transporter substrate-binding domain-containing protein [Rugamonas apoptosis]|uniref:Transporter substrate-binding domain-containing protein n=1 Tax=Rugamonas apoptosis TaxID=2758570 RepID=A0A7W2F764_9BURK|nr:transporter substrate-binding domain-containing protein [Rugamonas apoptosis]MBA5686234.1 transporter substrate-binding domain-containing protein [Rugamonas apoptosis]